MRAIKRGDRVTCSTTGERANRVMWVVEVKPYHFVLEDELRDTILAYPEDVSLSPCQLSMDRIGR